MIDTTMTRRFALRQAAGAVATGTGVAATRPAIASSAKLDFADPRQRASIQAKIMGSVAEETVNMFYRLNIYGYLNDGNLTPFFTINNLNVSHWKTAAER